MYGTLLRFKETETIFENPFMPSGVVIHEWKMMTNFSEDKVIPTLPILKQGHTYRFHIDYRVQPVDSVYFKVIFKRRNGTVCAYEIIKGHEKELTIPDETFSYVVQMINAASQRLIFRQLTIEDVAAQHKVGTGVQVSEMRRVNPSSSVATVIFVEQAGLDDALIAKIDNCVLVTGWDQPRRTHLIPRVVTALQKLAVDYQLQLVGYGVHSNAMAAAISARIPATLFVTSQQYSGHTEPLERSDVLNNPVVVYQYDDPCVTTCQWLRSVINQSHQLRGLDVKRLNGGSSA